MMLKSRPAVFGLGVLLVIFAVVVWRATHPPLSDEQRIAALVEDVRSAVATRNANRLMSYLADDFTWSGQGKPEASSMLRSIFFQTRDVEPGVSALKVSVEGETAIATGTYSLRYRMQNTKTTETRRGPFRITLEKRNGEWKITGGSIEL
jgi:ketosteroid isomerase-like protein